MKEERIFAALGEVDPALLARSEKQTGRRYLRPLAALAACLALALGVTLTARPTGIAPPMPTQPPVQSNRPSQLPALVLGGGEEGELYLCQDYEETAGPGFVIFVNQEVYSIAWEEESWVIRPRVTPGEGFPPIDMTITPLPGVEVRQAVEAAREALSGTYETLTGTEESEKGLFFRASAGTNWDSPQAQVYGMDDGEGGTFLITARYFLEAEEGHGVRFRDMADTFQVVLDAGRQEAPAWLDQLRETTGTLMDAYFANRLYQVADLLTGEAAAYSGNDYGADVSGWVSVAGVSWEVDNKTAPSKATVSVTHGGEQEGGYSCLTLGLVNTPEGWKLSWTGLEK